MQEPIKPYPPLKPEMVSYKTLEIPYTRSITVEEIFDITRKQGIKCDLDKVQIIAFSDGWNSISAHLEINYQDPEAEATYTAEMKRYNKDLVKYNKNLAKYYIDLRNWASSHIK